MKRALSLIILVLICAVMLTACGKVKTSVDSQWDDGFAKNYASDVKTDSNGKTTYEFTEDQYKNFTADYGKSLRTEAVEEVLGNENGQYTSLSEDGTEYVVGINGSYVQEVGIDQCKKEAEEAGKIILKYNMNTKNPTGKVTVIYKDANTGEEYFSIEVTA